MSALRILSVVALLAVAASAAYTYDGCGVMPKTTLFGNSSLKCQKGNDCLAAYCGCLNVTVGSNFTCNKPVEGQAWPNCTVASACIAAKFACLNKAADDVTCLALKDLKMSNIAVAGGQIYNTSAAYMSCKYDACKALNSTAGNCTLDLNTLCASPVVFVGTLRLKGDFSQIFASPALKARFQAALEKDLARALGFAFVVIIRMYIATQSRRQAGSTLIIEFKVPGVSIQNAGFAAALGGLTDSTWLVSALAEYKAVYGADASFTFSGISAGGASSAVFSASGSASTATSATTGSATTGSGSSASSATSGAATQSLVAAVVVAVVGAMLF